MKRAKFVKEVSVIDPDSNAPVEVAIYKHDNGGMFGIDSSYVEQVLDDEKTCVPDVFVQKDVKKNVLDVVELMD